MEVTKGIKNLRHVILAPQATYQIPLRYVPCLFSELEELKDLHPLINTIKLDSSLAPATQGFFFLVHYYLKSLDIPYQNQLKEKHYVHLSMEKRIEQGFPVTNYWDQSMETGIKQDLPVMSRLSFSQMYENMSEAKDATQEGGV